MNEGKYNKKIKKLKTKKYEYSEEGKLNKTLGLLGGSNHSISNEEINTLIKNLRHQESIGEITGLVIKDLPETLYITWDDDTLGAPILIQKSKKIIGYTKKQILDIYKKGERVFINDLKEHLEKDFLEVYYLGTVELEHNNEEWFSYQFIGKDEKIYILESKKGNFLSDVKKYNLVRFSIEDDFLKAEIIE